MRARACLPLLAVLTAVAGCGEASQPASSDGPESLTVAIGTLPATLDPARAASRSERMIAGAVHTPLLTYRRRPEAAAGQLVPALARAMPELSEDFREYRFQLRPGLLYADGRLVKASDVERAIAHASQVGADPELREVLRGIAGPATSDGETLRGVRSDDRTGVISVSLREPDGRLPYALAAPATAPLAELPRGDGAGLASTGPLRVARRAGGAIELVANPLRAVIAEVPAAGAARLSVVREARAADVWAGAAAAGAPPASQPVEAGAAAVTSLLVAPRGAFASRPVRRQLAEAIDRRAIGGGRAALRASCGVLPQHVAGSVARQPCPGTPADPPASGSPGATVDVVMSEGLDAAVREPVEAALEQLGLAPATRTADDPAAVLARGDADLAIVVAAPRLPHPAGWLEPAAAADRLVERELPELVAGPLTGSEPQWSSLARRVVDRAVVVPLAAAVQRAAAGDAVDPATVLLHPVSGLDLTALSRR